MSKVEDIANLIITDELPDHAHVIDLKEIDKETQEAGSTEPKISDVLEGEINVVLTGIKAVRKLFLEKFDLNVIGFTNDRKIILDASLTNEQKDMIALGLPPDGFEK